MNGALEELRASIRPVLVAAGPAAEAAAAWNTAVELGWLMTAAGEDQGGLGLGAGSMALVATELARQVSRVPAIAALAAIDVMANSALVDRVPALLGGDYLAIPLGDSSIRCADGHLDGCLEAIASGATASDCLAWTEDRSLLVVLSPDTTGVSREQTPTWDVTRSLSRATLRRVSLADTTLVARGPAATALIDRLLVIRDLLIAADCVGTAQGLLELTIDHLKVRVQFGRPLAMFQALKHRVADLRMLLDSASALLDAGVARFDEDPLAPGTETAALEARYIAAEACATVAEDCLQLHGGIGMAAEHQCHLYLKRAMLNRTLGRQDRDYAAAIADAFLANRNSGA